jgi:hypothetical protein
VFDVQYMLLIPLRFLGLGLALGLQTMVTLVLLVFYGGLSIMMVTYGYIESFTEKDIQEKD